MGERGMGETDVGSSLGRCVRGSDRCCGPCGLTSSRALGRRRSSRLDLGGGGMLGAGDREGTHFGGQVCNHFGVGVRREVGGEVCLQKSLGLLVGWRSEVGDGEGENLYFGILGMSSCAAGNCECGC